MKLVYPTLNSIRLFADIVIWNFSCFISSTRTKGFDVRVTSSSFYSNIYGENNRINRQLFDVHKQISSGLNIQYADDDPTTFIKTLRLDDEITTFSQIKNSVENALKMSTQTDTTISEIVKAVESIKVKLINAANETHSETTMQAIANELRGLQVHMRGLANSSINGQFLFAGSAVTTKPIDINGNYHGNDADLEAFMGSGVKQKYNISGAELFLGEEKSVNRTVSTNVLQNSLIDGSVITASSTIRDLMGDDDIDPTNDGTRSSYFYVQGTRTDGSSFKSKIIMGMNDTVDDLLKKIALTYDPVQTSERVSVSLNSDGQIEIIDKSNGSSKIDFHMVGAVDFSGAGAANVTDIDALQTGTTDFTAIGTNPLFIKEFTRSGLSTPTSTSNTIEGINYDRTNFVQQGAKLLSNISQIANSDNAFATPSTKLIDVSGVSTLAGKQLKLEGTTITNVPYTAQIDLNAGGSTFSLDGGITNYTIYNTNTPRTAVAANEMTYQQLMDVVNMVVTGSLPGTTTSDADYDTAISTANTKGSTTLDYAGHLVFEDKTATLTKAALSLYDNTSDTYPATEAVTSGPSLVFNANSALTIRDPKNDFFTRLEEIIQSVEQGKSRPDGSDLFDPRNGGIQNAIQMIDDLHDHVIRVHTEIGSYSQLFDITTKRTDMLIISAKTLRSEVIDTDIAEATLRMQQLNLNYQAMFSSISKVSQLSLVNYL